MEEATQVESSEMEAEPLQHDETGTEDSDEELHVCANCFVIFSTQDDLTEHLVLCKENWHHVKAEVPGAESEEENDATLSAGEEQEDLNQWDITVKPEFSSEQLGDKLKSDMKFRNTETSERSYECGECNKRFKRKLQLAAHLKAHKFEKRPRCYICKKFYTSQQGLVLHLRKIHGKDVGIHQCNKCDKSFNRKTDLNMHTVERHCSERCRCRLHSSEWKKQRECAICDKLFSSNDELKLHMLTHTDPKPFQCKVCFKKFSVKAGLMAHTRSHKMKTYTCHKCGIVFQLKEDLYEHLSLHHIKCGYCNKYYTDRGEFDRHVLKHGKQLKSGALVHVQRNKSQKPRYYCYQCDTVLHDRASLIQHDSKHVYVCDECRITLHGWSNLHLHLHQRHNGNNAFACKECDKFFTKITAVTAHMKELHKNKVVFRKITAISAPEAIGGLQKNIDHDVNLAEVEKEKNVPATINVSSNNDVVSGDCEGNLGPGKRESANSLSSHLVASKNINELVSEIDSTHECGECGTKLFSYSEVQSHMLDNHGSNMFYSCDKCNLMFTELSLVTAHMMKVHPKNDVAQDMRISDLQQLVGPPSISDTLVQNKVTCAFICGECGAGLTDEQDVRMHMHSQYSSNIFFTCDLCNSAFKGVPSMKAHMKTVHPNYKEL